MRRAFVLGHEGMLGHVVARVLRERGWEVLSSSKRYELAAPWPLVDDIASSKAEAIVNCVGTTTRRADPAGLFATNTLLPLHLAVQLGDRILVHASTDGVFAGERGHYRVEERPDARDFYGLSKALAEMASSRDKVAILRTSIVGPDRSAPRGLLSWFLTQRGAVTGFTDQIWNGITTLEWARLAADILDGREAFGLHQPACDQPVSKFELLETAASVYGHDVSVVRGNSGKATDLTLVPTRTCGAIREQLVDLRRWYGG